MIKLWQLGGLKELNAKKNENFEFWSPDRKFGVIISPLILKNLRDKCKLSNNIETGGILIGNYCLNYSCAKIISITDAPRDSIKSHNLFVRGIENLQKIINSLWADGIAYYIGEWHYHPSKFIEISSGDIKQMKKISRSKKYNCPEPICIILGKTVENILNIACYVFPKNKEPVELK